MANSAYDALVEAYNNFDYRPLKGEGLRKFYVDDFTKDTVKSIKSTVKITERYRKILVIGHTGCGKSTILNKVAEELKNDYHIVSFSVADELNMMDIDTIDILTVIYLQLVEYARKRQIRELMQALKDLLQLAKDRLDPNVSAEAGVELWKTLTFKIKVEPEFRDKIRKEFKTRLETLQKNITEACKTISQRTATFKLTEKSFRNLCHETVSPPEKMLKALLPLQDQEYATEEAFMKVILEHVKDEKLVERYKGLFTKHARTEKDILVIIDDLDKLTETPAEKIFCKETHLLTMLDAKIIFTFPLANYYSPTFVQIGDQFSDEFIRLVNLYNIAGEYLPDSLDMLKKLVLKRIEPQYVSDDAMKYLIDHSGGLLRDLVKFMQDACKIAIDEETKIIDSSTGIPQKVVQARVNEYKHHFDFPKYGNDLQEIIDKRDRAKINSEHLIHFLRYRFVLEYGKRGEESWYDAHPCLKKCLVVVSCK